VIKSREKHSAFLHQAISCYGSSALVILLFVPPPTHGNQLWVYEIPEAYRIPLSRKKPPVKRKGAGNEDDKKKRSEPRANCRHTNKSPYYLSLELRAK
jgi:hypothetical protein